VLDDETRPPERAQTDVFPEISVEPVDSMPTVLRVSFSTADPVAAWVEHDGLRTPAGSIGTEHELLVAGNPEDTDVTMMIAATLDGGRVESLPFVARTGQLPDWTQPALALDTPADDGFFLVVYQEERSWLVLLRGDGAVCWALPVTETASRVAVMARPSVSGGWLYNSYDGDRSEATGQLGRVGLDAELLEVVDIAEGHHAFTELPDGTLAYLAVDIREVEPWGPVVGDRVVEVAPDGSAETIFSVWDVLEPRTNATWSQGFYPQGADWTHGSGISWDVGRQAYTVTLVGPNQVLEFDRQGTVRTNIIGKGPPADGYTAVPEDAEFVRPHGASWTAEGELLVFSSAELLSRGGRYRLDAASLEAVEVARYGEAYGYHALTMGSLEALPDGRMLMNWGSAGVLQVLGADGAPEWAMATPLGGWFSDARYLSSPYATQP
jgi:hypothetical protein